MPADTEITPGSGRRVLRFLSGGPASVLPAAGPKKLLLEAAGRGSIAVEADILALLASRGVLTRTSHSIALSAEGASLARQMASSVRDAKRDVDLVSVETSSGPAIVLANLSESPLAQLARRKGKDGRPFLTGGEYEAGERLRFDYTRGRIMPRLGANWSASVASGKRSGAGGGAAELTDAALAARQRVDNAFADVGPELSGVLVDVCCFLKGLEQIEAERGWPVRSAKIVLKAALSALARHYTPKSRKPRQSRLHWGTEDYRPTIR